ncbi:MAG: hypothetical protein U5J63_09695 [Fodinibius sp.]|nr:hypothetical protein [Fodinibius sp.]
MDITQKTYLISFIVLIVCLALAAGIYFYTGNLIIAIFFAPPIIHWILERRKKLRQRDGG